MTTFAEPRWSLLGAGLALTHDFGDCAWSRAACKWCYQNTALYANRGTSTWNPDAAQNRMHLLQWVLPYSHSENREPISTGDVMTEAHFAAKLYSNVPVALKYAGNG